MDRLAFIVWIEVAEAAIAMLIAQQKEDIGLLTHALLRSLLGLFSWVTVVAHHLQQTQPVSVRQAAWYVKDQPTFADALSWVRQHLWQAS